MTVAFTGELIGRSSRTSIAMAAKAPACSIGSVSESLDFLIMRLQRQLCSIPCFFSNLDSLADALTALGTRAAIFFALPVGCFDRGGLASNSQSDRYLGAHWLIGSHLIQGIGLGHTPTFPARTGSIVWPALAATHDTSKTNDKPLTHA